MATDLSREMRLIGFYTLWHRHGGPHGLMAAGMGRATFYRVQAQYRARYGGTPDEVRP